MNRNHSIELEANDKILKLNFALLDYAKSSENKYAYSLDKNQELWIYTSDPTISIINPPYGQHTLTIKARGATGSWSDKWLSIPLFIQKPFYLQWWFLLGLFITIILLVFLIIQWRLKKLKENQVYLENEVKNRTQTIAKQTEELKVLDQAKTRFFSNITHEFRTPLTLVIGPIEQIIESKTSQSLKGKLSNVLKNAYNLLDLINQLLDISKLEANKMDVELVYGDFINFNRELVELFRPLVEKKGLILNTSFPLDVLKMHFDEKKWRKIVHNLLSNAIKFTPTNGTITVELQENNEMIQFSVSDTGIGISPKVLPRLFDRFYQANDQMSREQEGTGIGLALVKELVELQKGSISVTSKLNEGSSFLINLPLILEHTSLNQIENIPSQTLKIVEVEKDTIDLPIQEHTSTNDTKKLTLLLIEDNTDMRAYIRSCIDESKYKIVEAQDGEEGIHKAQEIIPDLIISDIMMPKKDGFEVTKTIRQELSTSHIPLILLTAKASLESRLEGLSRGADAYLTKPFSAQELVLRIQKLIELRKFLQQRYLKSDLSIDHLDPVFEKEDCFIIELKEYIKEHLNSPDLNVQAISRNFGISRTQIYRKMDALTNITIGQYIRSIRLNTALKLLEKGELNLTEIAYETGFSSLSHFSRMFKKEYKKTPSQWLK